MLFQNKRGKGDGEGGRGETGNAFAIKIVTIIKFLRLKEVDKHIMIVAP